MNPSQPVFDSHVHIFPDKVAETAVSLLAEKNDLVPSYNGTRSGLLAEMKRAGIGGALNCPIATKSDQVESINQWAITQNCWPILSLGSIHPDYASPEKCLTQIKKDGLRGIKMHPEYQDFRLDDPRCQVIWETCQDLGLLVLLHIGADAGFEPPFHSDPLMLRQMVEAYPRLQIIAAHFGGWKMWDQVETHLIGAPIMLDLSFTLGLLDDQTLVSAARRHGIEHILFGSDAPWRDQTRYLEHFKKLSFTPEEQQRILWKNASNLFGI